MRGRDLNPRPPGYEPDELPDLRVMSPTSYQTALPRDESVNESILALKRRIVKLFLPGKKELFRVFPRDPGSPRNCVNMARNGIMR